MFEFDMSKHPPLLDLGRALQASGSVRSEWGGQRGGGEMLCCGPIPSTAPNVRSSITPLRQHFSRTPQTSPAEPGWRGFQLNAPSPLLVVPICGGDERVHDSLPIE
ncbi:unnamed protein product [Arctogadus glacialis]